MPRPASYKPFTRAEKIKVRHLYLLKHQSPKEIAEKLGRTSDSVSQLCTREGWSEKRRLALEAAEQKADALVVGAIQARAVEFAESVADQSEELTEAGFELARKAAEAGSAKDFAFSMSGTGKAVALARQALAMDAGNGGLNINALTVVFAQPKADSIKQADTDSEVLDI